MSDRRDLPEDDAGEEMDLGEDQEADEIDDAEDGQDAADDDQDGENAPGDDEEERQARDVARPESRYQRNRREAQEAKREAAELRRRLDDLERRGTERPQGPDPQAAAREEQEFYQSLELMAPAQAIMAVRDRERRLMGSALQQSQAQMMDRMDRRDWERACETNRTRARLTPQVEQMIADARRQGNFSLDRETAYRYALGDEVDRRGRTEAPRQRAAGQRRIQRQTVRPGNGRGDAPRQNSRRSQDSDDEALLRGLTAADL